MLHKLTAPVVRGALLLASTGLLLESYQISEDDVPNTVLWLVRLIFVAIIAFSLFALAYQYVYLPTLRWHQSRRYQWPAVNKNNPDPNQLLLDRAEKQRASPATFLVITDRINMGFTRNASRPMLSVQIEYWNKSVYDLIVSLQEGYVYYVGGGKHERLPDKAVPTVGSNTVGAGGQGLLRFEVYIPPEFQAAICQEEDTPIGEIRGIRLTDLVANVRVKDAETSGQRWGLDSTRTTVFRPNR